MRKLLALTLLTLMAGCAFTPEKARNSTSFALCEMTVRGQGSAQDMANIQQELEARGYDCRGDYPAIAAKLQAQAAANAALFQGLIGASALMNAAQPQPYYPSQQPIVIEQQAPLPPVNIRPLPYPQAPQRLNIPPCSPFCK